MGCCGRSRQERDVEPYVIALAWCLREEGVIAIPRSSNPLHVQQNAMALELELLPEELARLEEEFPLPGEDGPLEWL